jgi:hypothetical protein
LHRGVDGVIAETRQFLLKGRADGGSIHAGHCQWIDPDNEN